MTALSLDFNNITTWENIDCEKACMRLSNEEGNKEISINPGAFRVCLDIFKKMTDKKERAKFFLNCEKLGLRHWKLYAAYKYPCKENYDSFIKSVLNSDEAMIKAVKAMEKLMVKK